MNTYFAIIGLLICCILLVRINIVTSKHLKWNNKVYQARLNMIELNDADYHTYTYNQLYGAIYGLICSIFMIWAFKLEDLIRDKKLYDIVIYNSTNWGKRGIH